jgi:hypothetical protein
MKKYRDEPICTMMHIYREFHKETPCEAILSKNVIFFIYKNRRTGGKNRSCVGGGLVPVGGGERAWWSEYGERTLYTCM